MRMRSDHFVYACLVSYLVSGANAWLCDLTLIGKTSHPEPLAFATADLLCTPGANETGHTLTVWVSRPLLSASFEGVTPQQLPGPGNDSVLQFTQSNITFRQTRLLDVDAWHFGNILYVNGSNTTFTGLQTRGCNARYAVLTISSSTQSSYDSSAVIDSRFSNATTQGLTVEDCNILIANTSFDGHTYFQGNGAAFSIYNLDGSSAQISDCNFTNNWVPKIGNADDGHGFGGAGDIQGPYLGIDRCLFENNTCTANGGALMLSSVQLESGSWAQNEYARITDCTFRNNTAVNINGGAVYYQGSNGDNDEVLYIQRSIFTGNNASSGGALSPWGAANVYITDSAFEHNIAYYGRGGALYAYGQIQRYTTLFAINTTFTANNATNIESSVPDGIFDVGECAGAHVSSCSCAGFLNTTFENNIGIGLCLRDISGGCEPPAGYESAFPPLFDRSSIAAARFKPMVNSFLGQDISINVAVDIRNSNFTGNTAASLLRQYAEPKQPQDPLAGGAALDMLAVPYSILAGNSFNGNNGRQGSAMHLDSCTATVIWNSGFDSNTATHEGGAIASVNSHGKGLLLGKGTITNSIALSGGAVYADSGASVIVTSDSHLTNNTAVTSGGAVSCVGCQNLTMQAFVRASFNQAQQSGGAVSCDSCTVFQLDQVALLNNSAGYGGAVYIAGTSANSVTLVNITRCNMESNTAYPSASAGAGGALYLDGGVSSLSNNTFRWNAAGSYGGAMAYRHECFNFSSVPGEQASVAYLWASMSPSTQKIAQDAGTCSLVQSQSQLFANNFASIAGGALYGTDLDSLQITCSNGSRASAEAACTAWSNNTVQAETVTAADGTVTQLQGYGNVWAFVPASINLEGPPAIANYVSSGNSKLPMVIHVQDQAGSTITSALSVKSPLRAMVTVSNMTAMPLGASQPLLQGQTQAYAQSNGTISIADLSLVAVPGVYNVSVTLPDYPQVVAAYKTVSVRACTTGEVQSSPDTCSACPASAFSFNSSQTACDICPANANCTGGANLVPLQQYWHSAPNSDWIIQCPNNNACLGDRVALQRCKNASYATGTESAQDGVACDLTAPMATTDADSYMLKQCSPGYYGPVCSLCLKNGTDGIRYGRSGIAQCRPCRSAGAIIVAYIASTVMVIVWLVFTIEITLQENEEDARGVASPGRTAELIKALTLWLQYITLLGAVNISAPAPVHWVLSAASFAFASVTSGALSTDCLQSGSTNTAVQRVLLHLAVPILVLLLLTVIQTFWWWRKPGSPATLQTAPSSSNPIFTASPSTASNSSAVSAASATSSTAPPNKLGELKRRLLVTLLTVTFYYYPSYLTTALSLFECYHIDPVSPQEGQHYPQNAQATWRWGYWVPDMTVQCFDNWHLPFSLGLGVPLLVLVVVGIPLLPTFLLAKHRRKLNTTAVKLRLGFVYTSYQSKFWFWDSCVLLQTLALAAAQVFATSLDTYFQLTIMLMVLVVGITVLAHYHPFQEPLSQSMQVFGLFTVVATATGCLYFLDVDDIAKTAGLTAAGVLLLIMNACFVAVMGLLISKRGGPTVIKWIVWSKNKTLTRMNQLLQICWPRSVHKGGLSNASSSSSNTGRTTSVQLGLLNRLSGQNQSQILTGASSSSRQNLMAP